VERRRTANPLIQARIELVSCSGSNRWEVLSHTRWPSRDRGLLKVPSRIAIFKTHGCRILSEHPGQSAGANDLLAFGDGVDYIGEPYKNEKSRNSLQVCNLSPIYPN
jgi:hypothetical protein